jgi:twinkle protein
MNDRADKGRAQIDHAIVNFPGLVPDNIDLSAFMDEDVIHRVKPAKAYQDRLIELITGGGEAGTQSPLPGMHGKFEFRPSELTVWSGYKGHGKSIVISQFLESFITKGEKVFIISPEFPAHRVLHRMMVQGVGSSMCTAAIAIKWLDAIDGGLWVYDQQGSLKARDIPALCRYAVDRLGVNHILIDSLMKCGLAPDDYAGQKKLVDSVQQVAHKSKVHIHLVAHARKTGNDEKIGGLHDIKGGSDIADLAENIIIVWRNKLKEMGGGKQEEPDCVVKVEAQRNGDGWVGKIPLYFHRHTMTFHEGGTR